MKKTFITASEIGDYVYCPRGWWLNQNNLLSKTPEMIKGISFHNSLNDALKLSPQLKIIAVLLIGIAILLFVLLLSNLIT